MLGPSLFSLYNHIKDSFVPPLPFPLTNATDTNASPADPSPPKSRFQTLLDDLPPELHKMIYAYTFSAGPTEQAITKSHLPPSALQVSRATRRQFAQSYYALNTFSASEVGTLKKWIRSLRVEDRHTVKRVHLQLAEEPRANPAVPAVKKGAGMTRHVPRAWRQQQQQGAAGNAVSAAQTAQPAQPEAETQKKMPPGGRTPRCKEPDHVLRHRANARLFFFRSALGKRKIKLPDGVVRVNVRFHWMEEEVWTSRPDDVYYAWKEEKEREEQFRAVMAEDGVE